MNKLHWHLAGWIGVLLLTMNATVAAQVFSTLHSFDLTHGADPYSALVQGANGDLYGATYNGGKYSGGTIFRITTKGVLTTVHEFGSSADDGSNPRAAPILASDGNFYGTTVSGGVNFDGNIYKLAPNGTVSTIYTFAGLDGEQPYGSVVQGADGNFYGTTYTGGGANLGTVFKVTPTGTLTTLYNFCPQRGCEDGSSPKGSLIQASDGNFYGTTYAGGSNSLGTVFKITPSGVFTRVYSFCSLSGCADGTEPYGGLIQAKDKNLYGTTSARGGHSNGTIFKVTLGGTLTTVYSFDGTDGSDPIAGVVQGTDGNFYGATAGGGANQDGTLFKITPGGALTTLHTFDQADGAQPNAGLVQATNGTFYGTTLQGGSGDFGTVFGLSAGLGSFVETIPTSGKIGRAVKVLGTNLTGTTSVTFNGTAAEFTVKSKSEITTTVPSDATTGKVKLVTPHGTLVSNLPFQIRH